SPTRRALHSIDVWKETPANLRGISLIARVGRQQPFLSVDAQHLDRGPSSDDGGIPGCRKRIEEAELGDEVARIHRVTQEGIRSAHLDATDRRRDAEIAEESGFAPNRAEEPDGLQRPTDFIWAKRCVCRRTQEQGRAGAAERERPIVDAEGDGLRRAPDQREHDDHTFGAERQDVRDVVGGGVVGDEANRQAIEERDEDDALNYIEPDRRDTPRRRRGDCLCVSHASLPHYRYGSGRGRQAWSVDAMTTVRSRPASR